MSRAAPATPEELRSTFEQLIADPPTDGTGVPTETGLDEPTIAAIERVWAASPTPPPSLIAAARQELEMQLDGTHAAEAQARMVAIFNEVAARRQATEGS